MADGAVEIEVVGAARPCLSRAAEAALAAVGVRDGHLAIALVGREEMRDLNLRHRGRDRPTDVLSFPVDGTGAAPGPRELGDVYVCPEETEDLQEAVVHGVLHLLGYDHERDRGEMLGLQDRIVEGLR